MADDDPFDVFSDDEDESTDYGKQNDEEASRIAKSLIEQANTKIRTSGETFTANNVDASQGTPDEVDLSHLDLLNLSWPPPLYIGSIRLVSALPYGGGRGYVATKQLEPGTLILVEEPMMEWTPEQVGKKLSLVSIEGMLQHENASKIIHDLEDFHPTKEQVDSLSFDEVSQAQISKMIQMMKSQYGESRLSKLVGMAKEKNVQSRDSSPLTINDIARMMLVLRYNGLQAGVYRHVAMLNHSCHPNCTKLIPADDKSYSEVRTTRVVRAGDSLTISYLPRIMSHASRRHYLWDQHRFDIGSNLKGEELKLELVGNSLPSSSTQFCDDMSATFRIEKATEDMEKMLDELTVEVKNGLATPEVWEAVKALEQSSLELYRASTQYLQSDHHLLLLPCLATHLDACDLVKNAPSLMTSVQLGIISRQVLTATRLATLQVSVLGPDHFDLARTNLDLADAVGELLSRSPKQLYDLNLPDLSSFENWSSYEHKARREHLRIKALYPHDAEDLLNRGSHRMKKS